MLLFERNKKFHFNFLGSLGQRDSNFKYLFLFIFLFQFTRLTLGYAVTNGTDTLNKLFNEVSKRNSFLPGESERFLDILSEVQHYLNHSSFLNDFASSARIFYNIINVLLSQEYSIINEKVKWFRK